MPSSSETDIVELRLELKNAKERNLFLESKISSLENELRNLKEQCAKYENIFSKCQRQLLIDGTCMKRDNHDITKAITIRAFSKKGFDYLRQCLYYPFPSPRTLSRRLSSIKCPPGLLQFSLDIMTQQAQNMDEKEKNLILSFDEMNVDSAICYYQKDDRIYGPCNYVQVIHARSIVGKWKQPVYYMFHCAVTPYLLTQVIQAKNLQDLKFVDS